MPILRWRRRSYLHLWRPDLRDTVSHFVYHRGHVVTTVEEWTENTVWKTPGWLLGICIPTALFFWAIRLVVEDPAWLSIAGASVLIIIGFAIGVIVYNIYFYPEIRASDVGIEVKNPFCKAVSIGWLEITKIEPSRRGLSISLGSNKIVRAEAVQTTGILRLVGKRSKADEIVDKLSQSASNSLGKVVDFSINSDVNSGRTSNEGPS